MDNSLKIELEGGHAVEGTPESSSCNLGTENPDEPRKKRGESQK